MADESAGTNAGDKSAAEPNWRQVVIDMMNQIETWLQDDDGSDMQPLWDAQDIGSQALKAVGIDHVPTNLAYDESGMETE